MRAGATATPKDAEGKRVPTEAEIAKQNEASMRELQRMMGGLGT